MRRSRSPVRLAPLLALVACEVGAGTVPPGTWVRLDEPAVGPYALMAPPRSAKGMVLLLGVPSDAALPRLLAARGIAVVAPPTETETMYLDRGSLDRLAAVLTDARERTGAVGRRIAVGGVSLGGTGAVRFAQHCALDRCDSTLVPVAVFAVDAPLDMERFWRSAAGVLSRGWPGSNLEENQAIVDRLVRQLGGPPQDHRASYASRSPFSYFAHDGGNARLLRDMPVRLYTEPDIEYWITERRFDYYNLNAFDAAGLVNRLLLDGNERAELIATTGQGVRPDGSRNPHSWSIVDEDDLLAWLLDHLADDGGDGRGERRVPN